jgi:hypothetical protein
MAAMRASIILDLGGNLAAQAKRNEAALGGLARSGERNMGLLSRSASAAGRGLDALGNRYTALLSGAAGIGTAKMVMDLEKSFTRMGIDMGLTVEEVEKLKKRVFEVAQFPDIRVDPQQIAIAQKKVHEFTGDAKFAQENTENFGRAIQALGVDGTAVGLLSAELRKLGITSREDVAGAFGDMFEAGRKGTFVISEFAAQSPKLLSMYSLSQRMGRQALREAYAIAQVARPGAGSAEEAITSAKAVLRTLYDNDKIKMLSSVGISVIDKEASRKAGREVFRDATDVMAEVVEKSKGQVRLIGQIFDAEALPAFSELVKDYAANGKVTLFDQYKNLAGDGKAFLEASARGAKGASAALENLFTAWKKFSDESLSGPIQSAADALNMLGTEATGKAIKGIVSVGLALGGLVALRKAYTTGRGLYDFFSGGAGKAAGGLGAGLTGPIPVYVVNGPGAVGQAGGGAAGIGAGLSRRASLFGKLGTAAKWGGRIGGALAVGGTAYDLYNTWNGEGSTNEKITATGKGIGGLAGAWGGAKLGAAAGGALGAFFGGVGAAPGAAIGGLLGGIGGFFAGRLGGEALGEKLTAEDIGSAVGRSVNEKEARLRIEIAGPGTVRDLRARGFEPDVYTGLYMGGAD